MQASLFIPLHCDAMKNITNLLYLSDENKITYEFKDNKMFWKQL